MSNNFSLTPSQENPSPASHDPQTPPPREDADKNLLETIHQLTAERNRLQGELDAARTEHAKTAAALAEITEERDTYHRELLFLLRKDVTITEAELEDVLKNGVSFAETVHQIELDLFGKG
jgi:hypothetical protein